MREEKNRGKAPTNQNLIHSIRFQLSMGFMVPILFILVVGLTSYRSASRHLTENYTTSAINALEMTAVSVDDQLNNAMSDILELTQDATLKVYSIGGYKNDTSKESEAEKYIRNQITVKQSLSQTTLNITVIPMKDEDVQTTMNVNTTELDSFIEGMKASEDSVMFANKETVWGTIHPYLDQQLGYEGDEYALYVANTIQSGENEALVVIDLSTEALRDIIGKLDFGKGSQVSFITGEKEIANNDVIEMKTLPIYEEVLGRDDLEDGYSKYITVKGKEYLFMINKASLIDGYVCALVPKKQITSGSMEIFQVTILLILIAAVVAIAISTFFVRNISRNIKLSVRDLNTIAEGVLTSKEDGPRKVRNEFGLIHNAISKTTSNIRRLVLSIRQMAEVVSEAGIKVSISSRQTRSAVEDIGDKVRLIHESVADENTEIVACQAQMEELSTGIKSVSGHIMAILSDIGQADGLVTDGITVVNDMNKQSEETTSVTEEVRGIVDGLGEQITMIESSVVEIQKIAELTKLLALNASIEAARAGEHGKGFAVVAEEIQNLATNSSVTAKNIQETIASARVFSENAISKTQTANDIVFAQVKSVENTGDVFEKFRGIMSNLSNQTETLSQMVNDMNELRHQAVCSINNINDLSRETVETTDEMYHSVEQQIATAEELEQEAGRLRDSVEKLNESIVEFVV